MYKCCPQKKKKKNSKRNRNLIIDNGLSTNLTLWIEKSLFHENVVPEYLIVIGRNHQSEISAKSIVSITDCEFFDEYKVLFWEDDNTFDEISQNSRFSLSVFVENATLAGNKPWDFSFVGQAMFNLRTANALSNVVWLYLVDITMTGMKMSNEFLKVSCPFATISGQQWTITGCEWATGCIDVYNPTQLTINNLKMSQSRLSNQGGSSLVSVSSQSIINTGIIFINWQILDCGYLSFTFTNVELFVWNHFTVKGAKELELEISTLSMESDYSFVRFDLSDNDYVSFSETHTVQSLSYANTTMSY
ncbi:hypothetical protein RFI_19240, partial [Reticulomyxa filosa]